MAVDGSVHDGAPDGTPARGTGIARTCSEPYPERRTPVPVMHQLPIMSVPLLPVRGILGGVRSPTGTKNVNEIPRVPRIALVGMSLESNAFAPVATEADFRARYYLEGEEIPAQARHPDSVISTEMVSFVGTLDATGPWEAVPTVVTDCPPWGPVDHAFFAATVDAIAARLEAAAPLDAVYVANHGAMVSTETPDPDGAMLARIRAAAGPNAAIVATLDLHANISERMVEAADVIIGYQTNPHVDMRERGEEAAHTVRAMLAGMRPRGTLVRLPLTPPSVTLLSASGPYGELIDYGQRRKREHGGAILNVSIFGGFVFGDTPKNGLAVVVTGREDEAPARALALEIAERAWSERARYARRLTSIEDAVALSNERPRAPVIFSDAGDNPGGGGGGNTTWLLRALVEAGAREVLYGSFFDPELARAAREAGVGASIDAVFNSAGETEFAKRLEVPAVVRAVHEGFLVGRRGIYAGRSLDLAPMAALEIGGEGGITAVVISARHQTADPVFFEALGLEVGTARTVCVKSRGHFRAGFDLWFAPDQVYEIDTPGVTAPVLDRFAWKGLPRPVYPLDPDTVWTPPSGPA